MRDTKDSDEACSRHRNEHPGTDAPETRDKNSFSLTLRPADFGDEPRDVTPTESPVEPHPSSSQLGRPSFKRRELIELAGNPFVIDSQSHHGDGEPRYRRDIYPAYDETGRRIGLDHVRNTSASSEGKGYYRKHVHEYDNARGVPLPLPSQMPIQSKYPEQGPLPPVSAVIAGIPSDSEYGVGDFSHIQNRPRTPHEILGLSSGLPLNLWSLADPEPPDSKPQYNYHVLVKLAILGNKGQKATLQDILRAIRLRFPYYSQLLKPEAIAFGNSIRHLLSLLAAFVREPKPVTEPGKGSYWRVDFSKGEGNKRVRKRNKPQRKTGDEQASDKQDMLDDIDSRDNRSESNDSQPSASASVDTSNDSPVFQSPIDMRLQTPKPRGGRKPAPKNLITTPNGGTATVPVSSAGEPQDGFYGRHDPARMDRGPGDSALLSRPTPSTSEPYLQLYPSNIGAHREHVARGAVRSAPYPSPLPMPSGTSSTGSVSSSSEREYRRGTVSPEDTHSKNGNSSSVLSACEMSSLHEQQPDQRNFAEYSGRDSNVYAQQQSFNHDVRYNNISPQGPHPHNQSPLPTYANKTFNLPPGAGPYHEHVSDNPTGSHHAPRSAGTAYHTSSSSASLSVGAITGQSSATIPSSSSYGFASYPDHQDTNGVDISLGRSHASHSTGHSYTTSTPWSSVQSMDNQAESSRLPR